jgi:oligopeptide transport system substrate-binding protein
VGNGPYLLTQWRYKRDMRLERNPLFHSPQRVRCDSIASLSIDDPNTAVLAFESGQIDWVSDVTVDYQADMLAERRAYEQRHAAEIRSMLESGRSIDEALASLPPPQRGQRRNISVFPTFGTDFFSFNCRPHLADGRPNPFADARVRRAFTLAVDKKVIVERVTRLHEPVATTFVPPGSIPGYRSPAGLPHDPARGRAELAAAGWSDRNNDGFAENARGEAFPEIEILFTTNTARYKNIALALRDMWQRELGVRIVLRGKDTKFYKDDLKAGNFMIARGGWYGDYGDPTTFLDLCRTHDGNNDRKYSHPYVDGLLEKAAAEPDPDQRFRLLEECERFLFDEEVPMLVLCQFVQLYMYEPGRVTGISLHPRMNQHLWQIGVEPP